VVHTLPPRLVLVLLVAVVQVDVLLVVDGSLWHPARRQRRCIGPGNTGPQHRPAEGAGPQRRCHIQ
jgi:hypothetical protein